MLRPRSVSTLSHALALFALVLPAALPALAGARQPVRSLAEIRHEKIVLQQFDLSCGAAALATILRYQHGESLSERDVALGLISRDIYIENPRVLRLRQGFSLLDMRRFTTRLGYDGQAFGSVTYEDLLALAPAIVPVRLHGYSHFVVFRGELQGTVLFGDPAFGNRTLTRQRFLDAWIDYADLGHVAFVVRRLDGLIPPNQLTVGPADFPLLGRETLPRSIE